MAAKYQVVAADLRRRLGEGTLPCIDGRLPSEHALSEEYRISRDTTRRALSLLARDGVIDSRRGSGSYLTGLAMPPRVVAIVSPYPQAHIVDEIRSALTHKGYQIEIFATQGRLDRERRILEQLITSRVCGIIAQGTCSALPSPNDALFQKLEQAQIPLVFLGETNQAVSHIPCFASDDLGGGYLLVNYLSGLGHRMIGGIFNRDELQGLHRYQGFQRALLENELSMRDDHVLLYGRREKHALTEYGEVSFLRSYLHLAVRSCTAFVCHDDEIALWAIRTLQAEGVDVPSRVSVVGFGNSHYSEICSVPITTLDPGDPTPALLAAHALLDRMAGCTVQGRRTPWVLKPKSSTAFAAENHV